MQHRDVPDEEPCAPCEEIDFTRSRRRLECNNQLNLAESFDECCEICEVILNFDERGPRSRAMRIRKDCRCLCKSMHLQEVCPGKYSKIQYHVAIYTASCM